MAADVQGHAEGGRHAGNQPILRHRKFFSNHAPPHFHAEYAGHEALIMFETLEVLRGHLPRRALALVLEWAAAHRKELRGDWDLARAGQTLAPIPPLE